MAEFPLAVKVSGFWYCWLSASLEYNTGVIKGAQY